jgi:N-acetylmuramoyl-L-alanine amidase
MSTGIKNGKVHTNNTYIIKLIFLYIGLLFITLISEADSIDKTWIIVIDAGHGGKDPGALGAFSREKDINLAIALKTGEYIEKNIRNVKVIYTRKDDSTVDLMERPKIANKNNADLFISIHANWAKQRYVMGAETYIMGHGKDQANLEVAMKENEVILLEEDYSTKYEGFDPKSPESYIMFTLMQKVYQDQSTDLATKIQTQFRERVARNDRDVKQAGFWVLFTTTMPSVLIETGFITNAAEEKFLNSQQGQDYLASAIFRACRDYIN